MIRKGKCPVLASVQAVLCCYAGVLCLDFNHLILCLEPNHLINRSLSFASKLYSVPQFTIYVLIKASLQWRCSQDLKIPSSASEAVECRNLFFCLFFGGWGERGVSLCMYMNNSNHCVLLQCRHTFQHATVWTTTPIPKCPICCPK